MPGGGHGGGLPSTRRSLIGRGAALYPARCALTNKVSSDKISAKNGATSSTRFFFIWYPSGEHDAGVEEERMAELENVQKSEQRILCRLWRAFIRIGASLKISPAIPSR